MVRPYRPSGNVEDQRGATGPNQYGTTPLPPEKNLRPYIKRMQEPPPAPGEDPGFDAIGGQAAITRGRAGVGKILQKVHMANRSRWSSAPPGATVTDDEGNSWIEGGGYNPGGPGDLAGRKVPVPAPRPAPPPPQPTPTGVLARTDIPPRTRWGSGAPPGTVIWNETGDTPTGEMIGGGYDPTNALPRTGPVPAQRPAQFANGGFVQHTNKSYQTSRGKPVR